MSSAMIMEAILTKIKAVLSEAEEVLASGVTPEASEAVNRLLGEAMSAGWTEGLQTWLATAETDAETIEVEGKTYRYKLDSEKEFLTPGGIDQADAPRLSGGHWRPLLCSARRRLGYERSVCHGRGT